MLSLALFISLIELWARSCNHTDIVSVNTAWGQRANSWVQRDLTFRSRLGSLMIGRRTRTWIPAVPEGHAPHLLERRDLTVFGGDIWSAVGQFSAASRNGARPVTKRSEPRLTFEMSWVEFPVWLPAAVCLGLPIWQLASIVRRLRRLFAADRTDGTTYVLRPAWWGWRAAGLEAGMVLIVLAAGAAGMPNVAAAIGLPAAAVALIVLTDLPQAWRARGR